MYAQSNYPPRDSLFDISILHKTYEFFIALYGCVERFPKKDRYTLGQKSEQLALHILELLFMANAAQTRDRLALQQQIDMKLKILKTIVRASYDVKALHQKQYLRLESHLYEIGRMLGGWIKATKEDATTKQENPV